MDWTRMWTAIVPGCVVEVGHYVEYLQHDWTFSFNGEYYQLNKVYGSHLKPKSMITVRRHLDHSVSVWYGDESLAYSIVPARQPISVTKEKTVLKINRPTRKSSWGKINSIIFEKVQSIPSKIALRKRGV